MVLSHVSFQLLCLFLLVVPKRFFMVGASGAQSLLALNLSAFLINFRLAEHAGAHFSLAGLVADLLFSLLLGQLEGVLF